MLYKLVVVAVFLLGIAQAAITVKKNYNLFDPSFCYLYQRSSAGVCTGFQYDCSIDTNPLGSTDTFATNCASDLQFKNWASSDFPTRYAAYKAAQG